MNEEQHNQRDEEVGPFPLYINSGPIAASMSITGAYAHTSDDEGNQVFVDSLAAVFIRSDQLVMTLHLQATQARRIAELLMSAADNADAARLIDG